MRLSKRVGITGGLVVAVAAGVWLWNRPAVPDPPAVDVSRADPAVADAVAKATAAVKADPRSAAAWGELGMVLRANDFDTDSVRAFEVAERLDPADWRWPYLQGLTLVLFEPDRGTDCLKRAADRAPADRPEAKLRLAEVLFDAGDTDAAGRLAEGSNGPRAALIQSQVLARRGDWAGVVRVTEPHRSNPLCRKRMAGLRGDALQRLGDADRAAAEWGRHTEMVDDPAWPDNVVEDVLKRATGTANRVLYASGLLADGRTAKGVGELRQLIANDPNASAARLLLGRTLIQGNDPHGARGVLRELTARDPESVEGWFQYGVAAFLVGDTAAAAAAFERTAALKPDHALAHFNLGHCHKKRGDRPAARAAFEAALRCKPDHRPAVEALRELK
jgi:tetratricopeptide (TPR) repeat protein